MFSSQPDIAEPVERAFDATTSESKILHEDAAILRVHIKEAHSSAVDMPWPWPPTPMYLQSSTVTPSSLQ